MCGISEASGPGAVSHSSDTGAASVAALRALVPQPTLCGAAFDFVLSASLPLSILHHSFRVYLFANWLAAKEKSEWEDSALLFVACITHDIGTSGKHDGPQRFEVEGADAAAELLRSQGHSEADAHEVWTAIALHTSPGIAERITPMARLVRLGVMIDFRPAARSSLGADDYGEEVETKLPRLDIEKILGDAVVEQAKNNPTKAPAASWPGILYKSHLENLEWTGVNRAF